MDLSSIVSSTPAAPYYSPKPERLSAYVPGLELLSQASDLELLSQARGGLDRRVGRSEPSFGRRPPWRFAGPAQVAPPPLPVPFLVLPRIAWRIAAIGGRVLVCFPRCRRLGGHLCLAFVSLALWQMASEAV